MSITFTCECGQRLRAQDDQVGRKGRCPTCSSFVIIPRAMAAAKPGPPPIPEAEWYYLRDGIKGGPVTFQVLQYLISSEQLVLTDLVWKDGMTDWIAVGMEQGLSTATSNEHSTEELAGMKVDVGLIPVAMPSVAPSVQIRQPDAENPSAGQMATSSAREDWGENRNHLQWYSTAPKKTELWIRSLFGRNPASPNDPPAYYLSEPLTFQDLRDQASSGALFPSDRVKKVGEEWLSASSVGGLWPPAPTEIVGKSNDKARLSGKPLEQLHRKRITGICKYCKTRIMSFTDGVDDPEDVEWIIDDVKAMGSVKNICFECEALVVAGVSPHEGDVGDFGHCPACGGPLGEDGFCKSENCEHI